MSRFNDEMKVIPRPAWVIAMALALVFVGGAFLYGIFAVENSSTFGWSIPLVLMGTFIFVMFFIYVLLVGYIYGDAKRRGMRPVLWALLAFFVPNAIGVLLYFILRDPMLVRCPKCGAGTKPAFPFCPSCGASLSSTCPACRSSVEPGWTHCARCGAQLQAVRA
jgi:double zinc ribbon protein